MPDYLEKLMAGSRRSLLGALTLIFATFGDLAAGAQTGNIDLPPELNHLREFAWHTTQYEDPDIPGNSVTLLSYGIPETDAVGVRGRCATTTGGRFGRFLFAFDVSGMKDGAPVMVTFSTDKFSRTLPATVLNTKREFDEEGLEVVINNTDPLWKGLGKATFLTYSVDKRQNRIVVANAARAIGQFINDCQFYAGVQGASDPKNREDKAPTDPRWATCETFSNRHAQKSDVPVELTFINQTDGTRGIMWIDFSGRPIEYANLDKGDRFTVSTFQSHPWMITDGPGNCLEMTMPEPGTAEFRITAPNRDFGPE